eukprot:CAMPEP_0178451670 /NCGR_PEP_ID=MMETSP0689_2-20121128/43813_1 /TAXON_ID=160604 /ORGANISM="Amphidinium massartii, Strain CS-259" /LENGTH=41 /DNA_ID= /DNA_START= /DNA_END= /DNA_ORIENTATION=
MLCTWLFTEAHEEAGKPPSPLPSSLPHLLWPTAGWTAAAPG